MAYVNKRIAMNCIVAAFKLSAFPNSIGRVESQSIKIISRIMPDKDPKIVFSHLWPLQKLSVLSQAMAEIELSTSSTELNEWYKYEDSFSKNYEIIPEALIDFAFKDAVKQLSKTNAIYSVDQPQILYIFEQICDNAGWDKTAVINKRHFFSERSDKLFGNNKFTLI
ncbi:MAG: hypothetical protein K8S13_20410 [Desulfobacula sp.]|uniref:hypothetical protein n=1 Tax=Desulfobacula sp. TaxID=2593537 RepID=UPI0025B8A814|nr:hypothetical protein [Desulfobacula sp.]MCD4722200.1 hypothetical protein [Desulfobacula sp.]